MKLHKLNYKRVRELNSKKSFGNGPILYLMSRDQRVSDNRALLFAQNQAIKKGAPLLVAFILRADIPRANRRHYDFMIKGLKGVEKTLAEKNIKFIVKLGTHKKMTRRLINELNISEITVDFAPTRAARKWRKQLAKELDVPVYEVDTHNIVPAWIVSDKQEYAAYTFRKKVNTHLEEFVEPTAKIHKHPFLLGLENHNSWKKIDYLTSSMAGENLTQLEAGEEEANKVLDAFIKERLSDYGAHHNNPNKSAISGLSSYFHFGQLSANSVIKEIFDSDHSKANKDAFLEQLIVRKELSDNYCYYNKNYDNFGGFPHWARRTLNDHKGDKRKYLYSEREFEKAETHDDLWNAAQIEMVKQGKTHGYMRMYWAKKILEWSKSPEEAQYTAIYLNDKYSIDGRDPNGYTGIAWSIGGVHDRPWPERKIFGKVRYMNYSGAKRKFDVDKYIEKVNKL